MTKTRNLSLETMNAYCVLGKFCSTFMLDNPTDEVIGHLVDRRNLLLEEPFSSVAPLAAAELHRVLTVAQNRGLDLFKIEVSRDYTYLFYMVGASHTSPFESVYRTDDRTMFGPTTLEVRELYQSWGVQIPKQGSIPDDHLGFEFLFLSHLFDNAQHVVESDAELIEHPLDVAASFLSDHVLVFAPLYLNTVETRAQTSFYKAIAQVAQAMLISMSACLDVEFSECIGE